MNSGEKMITKSTNINNTNNHFSPPNNWTQKRSWYMALHILDWDRDNNVAGLNQFLCLFINSRLFKRQTSTQLRVCNAWRFLFWGNCIGGVMVSVLALSAVGHGFKPGSGLVKPKTIKLVFIVSPLRKDQTGWIGIRIMCPSGATCLPADCCFSELAL